MSLATACATCKRPFSSATSESEPNVQPEKQNSDGKKQTSILKYFVQVKKKVKKQVKKQETPFRMISLRGNKQAFEKLACIFSPDKKISSITKGPSQSPQKKDKRKPSINETSQSPQKKDKRKPSIYETSQSPQKKDKRKPSINETSMKRCYVKIYRLPPALTKLLLSKMNVHKNDELALGIVSGQEPFHGFSSSCKYSSLTRYQRLQTIIDAACKRKA